MKKSVEILVNLGFWFCYFVLIMVTLGMYFRGEAELDERIGDAFEVIFIFAVIPSTINFYAFYFFLFPKYILKQKIVPSIGYGLLISLIAACIGFGILTIAFGSDCLGEEGSEDTIGFILFIAFISLISGIVALVIKGFLTWFEEIKLKEALKEKNHQMELALVKSQLDPHFLFNTINNIDVLILKNAETASTYLNKLSDIMRFMLFETKSDAIPLSKELQYIERYIDLQKIRTTNTKYVNYSVVGDANGHTIAPMLFIPFIENAFKHTNNKKLENAIDISLHVEKNKITFVCINKFDPNRRALYESNGLGNQLIEKRLELLYPDQHTLEVVHEKNYYQVQLIIALEASPIRLKKVA